MKKFPWKAVAEACKEPLRIAVLAIIPVLLAYLGTINAEWAIILVVLLRFADKILYEVGKAKKNELLEGGLTRF
jgi:hypothetical protein